MSSKVSAKLYFDFILKKPLHFFAAFILALFPFILETLGFLSFIPLIQSNETGTVQWKSAPITLEFSQFELIVLLAVLFTLQWVLSTAKVFVSFAFAKSTVETQKAELFENLQKQNTLEVIQQNKGLWLQVFQNEFKQLTYALVSSIYICASLFFCLITLIVLFFISPSLTLGLIPLGLLVLGSMAYSNKIIHRLAQKAQATEQQEANFLLNSWQHPIAIHLNDAKKWVHDKYVKILFKTQHQNFMHLATNWSTPHWTRWVIFMCILLFLMVHAWLPENSRMSTPLLITYLIILSRLQPITYTLSHDLGNLQTGQVAWDAMQNLKDRELISEQGQPFAGLLNNIEVKDLLFFYPDRNQNLGPHSFDIPAKTCFGLHGPSGSGKTTLMLLLMGFLKPKQGHIRFNEQSLEQLQLKSLWKKLAYVPQEADFYEMSLRENLCLGQTHSDASLIEEIESWGLKDWFKTLPAGLDETLYPDAKNLSGGQKKKLMMVRAMLKQPELIFLDEPCAGLDQTSKKDWIQHMQEHTSEQTVVLITHDKDLLDLCDVFYEVSAS